MIFNPKKQTKYLPEYENGAEAAWYLLHVDDVLSADKSAERGTYTASFNT